MKRDLFTKQYVFEKRPITHEERHTYMHAKRPTNTQPPHTPEKWGVTSRGECVRWGLTGSRSSFVYVGLFAYI